VTLKKCKSIDILLDGLRSWLHDTQNVAVAASGGVDSTTLAIMAHRVLGDCCTVFHAVSPAVPPAASERLLTIAENENWNYQVVNAGEFNDQNYLQNPVNRCFYCKKNLYKTIASRTMCTLISGTNADDMEDFRPGLQAAADYAVRHPYVELGVGKSEIRKIALNLGFENLSDLPASPCLSSRMETGIPIDPDTLKLIDSVERHVLANIDVGIVRCRIRSSGMVVELDEKSLMEIGDERKVALGKIIKMMVNATGVDLPVHFDTYRQGSAFLQQNTA